MICHFLQNKFSFAVRDSSVGIATRYRLEGLGIEFRWCGEIFRTVQTDPRAHLTSYTLGTGSGVKRPERDVENPSHLAPRLKKL